MRTRARTLVAAAIVAIAALLSMPAATVHAQEEDLSGATLPDTVFQTRTFRGPDYLTIFDLDNTRSNWTQNLTYTRTTRRFAVSANGNLTTQELSGFENKSTFGQFYGRVSTRLTRRWLVSLDGRHNMSSTTDGSRDADSRRNRLQLKTQYTLNPTPQLSLVGSLSSEFRRENGLSERRILKQAFGAVGVVDTLRVQRDSSFTTGRQDGLLGALDWRPKSWLTLNGTANASRVRPTQFSLVRDFTNAQGGSGGGYAVGSPQRTNQPTDNATYTSKISLTKFRGHTLDLDFSKSALDQSTFDKQLRGVEKASFDRNSGSFRLQSNFGRELSVVVDGALVRFEREYALRTNYTSLVHTRQMSALVAFSDSSTRLSTAFSASRNRSERQATGNGTIIDRSLNANGYQKISGRLAVDASASVSLRTATYEDVRSDQDATRINVGAGGGYRVSAACSTTVHFSATRSHGIFIDPSASATNAVQSTYQMNATMRLQASRTFLINQGYLLSADYKIFDFTEDQNLLNRVRRIDTDVIDTVFSFAYVRLTHNFIFRDQGTYSRDPGESSREYQVSQETYDQTLAATIGVKVAQGIRLMAKQSLLNQRNHYLAKDTRTLRNIWNLTTGMEIERTIWNGATLSGAVRHIGTYDERDLPNIPNNEEEYWIAGVTLQKQF